MPLKEGMEVLGIHFSPVNPSCNPEVRGQNSTRDVIVIKMACKVCFRSVPTIVPPCPQPMPGWGGGLENPSVGPLAVRLAGNDVAQILAHRGPPQGTLLPAIICM